MNADKLLIIITLGTVSLFLLAIALIGFIVIYQRKIFAKQSKIAFLETENQKAMIDAILTTKEKEQKRIAQELHDEIGSSINAVKMSLISMDIPKETRNKLSEDLVSISKNVRKISNELMPSVLEELGFHHALVHLIKKMQDSSSIHFEIHNELVNPYPIDKSVELSLYRVLQELINNICKYSQASEVILTVHHTPEILDINLVDNGSGFIPSIENLSKSDSLGLKNIKSRLQQIHGTDEYSINEPKGTKVSIHLKRP